MTVIFKAKTHNAYTIKILAELLQNNIKTACFEIDAEGIKLCMMDHHRTILIQVALDSENFTLYKFKPVSKIFLSESKSLFVALSVENLSPYLAFSFAILASSNCSISKFNNRF